MLMHVNRRDGGDLQGCGTPAGALPPCLCCTPGVRWDRASFAPPHQQLPPIRPPLLHPRLLLVWASSPST